MKVMHQYFTYRSLIRRDVKQTDPQFETWVEQYEDAIAAAVKAAI